MPRSTEEAIWEMGEVCTRARSPPMACPIRSSSHSHLCRCCSSNGSDLAGLEKRFDTSELHWLAHTAQLENSHAGCSKSPASEAAADGSTGGVASGLH